MYAKSPRIVQSGNSLLGVKVYFNVNIFEQQYFTEQYILTRTEEGHEKD